MKEIDDKIYKTLKKLKASLISYVSDENTKKPSDPWCYHCGGCVYIEGD